jgi:hypothetical protein
MHIGSNTQPVKKKGTNKLVLGFAAVLASAVVGTTGLAAAHTMGDDDHHGHNGKPDKHQCEQAGFKNFGQCVKEWAHHKNHPGGGYNGNTNVNANVGVHVNGNNNVITVIINFFR